MVEQNGNVRRTGQQLGKIVLPALCGKKQAGLFTMHLMQQSNQFFYKRVLTFLTIPFFHSEKVPSNMRRRASPTSQR